MALGGISNTSSNFNSPTQSGSMAGQESSGKEFSLEQQQAGSAQATGVNALTIKKTRSKTTSIVDKKKRNKKGAPRTLLVDGEIYEVYLLAIA